MPPCTGAQKIIYLKLIFTGAVTALVFFALFVESVAKMLAIRSICCGKFVQNASFGKKLAKNSFLVLQNCQYCDTIIAYFLKGEKL